MSDETRAAARARGEQVGIRSSRPRGRRNAAGLTTESRGVPVLYRAAITVRDLNTDASQVSFAGMASTYEQPYEMHDAFGPYTEVVSAGAGAKSLARTDLDVPLVLQHDPLRRLARTSNGTLNLRETSAGLQVDAPSLSMDDADVAYIVPKLRAGLIDEMSFAFTITRGTWSPDFEQFRIEEFDIHRGDVAIVAYGANPNTTAALREQRFDLRELIPVEETRLLHYI